MTERRPRLLLVEDDDRLAPIIMLTALGTIDDRVEGSTGAPTTTS